LGENLSSRTPAKPPLCRPCPVRLADPAGDQSPPVPVSCAGLENPLEAPVAQVRCAEKDQSLVSSVPLVEENLTSTTAIDLSPMSEQSGDVTTASSSSDEASNSSLQLSSSATAATTSSDEAATATAVEALRTKNGSCCRTGDRSNCCDGDSRGVISVMSQEQSVDEIKSGEIQQRNGRLKSSQSSSCSSSNSPGSRQQQQQLSLQSPNLIITNRISRARSEEPPGCAQRSAADSVHRTRLKSDSCCSPVCSSMRAAAGDSCCNSVVSSKPPVGCETNKENVLSSSTAVASSNSILPPKAFRDSYNNSSSSSQSPQRKHSESMLDHIRKIR